jgi:hypothetical protein
LAVLAVPDVLEKRLADSLSEGAHDLPVDEQRVDGVATVVHRDEPIEPNQAGLPIHAHDGYTGTEAECWVILPEEDGGLQPGRLFGREPGAAMSEVAYAIPSDHPFRHALHVKAAGHRLDVPRARFEQPGCQPPAFLSDLGGGLSQRAAAESGAAAPERPIEEFFASMPAPEWPASLPGAASGTTVPMLYAELGDAVGRRQSFRHLQARTGAPCR